MLYENQATLGHLRDALHDVPDDVAVSFDFPGVYIDTKGEISSYRGYYEDLAIPHTHKPSKVTAGQFREMLDSVPDFVTGYKGGEYAVGVETAMWVANYGQSDECAVVKLHKERDTNGVPCWCVLMTRQVVWQESPVGGHDTMVKRLYAINRGTA